MSITAMKQALEALDSLFNWQVDEQRGNRCVAAISALRTAISEAEKPFCWLYYERGEEMFAPPDGYRPDDAQPLFLEAGAQPAPEVTKDSIRAAGGIVHSDGNVFFTSMDQIKAMLATAPAQPTIRDFRTVQDHIKTVDIVGWRWVATCGSGSYQLTDYEPMRGYSYKSPVYEVPPVQAQERKPKWNVLAITTAYEQGFGKGIQAKHRGAEINNPYAEGDCREAWAYGYEEGNDKPKSAPPQAQPAKLLTDEQIDAAWRSVDYTQPYEDFRMAVGRAIEAKVKERP